MIRSNGHNMYSGSIALLSVVLISAIMIISIVGVALVSTDIQQVSLGSYSRNRSKILMESCIEESVRRINVDRQFTGNISLTLDGNQCNSVITSGGTYVRNLAVTATVDEYSSSMSLSVDTSETTLSVVPN